VSASSDHSTVEICPNVRPDPGCPAKDYLASRYHLADGPGATHFPEGLLDDYYDQLTAEYSITVHKYPTSVASRETVVISALLDNVELIDKIFEFIQIEFPEMRDKALALKELARREFAGIETYVPRRSPMH
jgi:hypothetical protein